jgi:hypothetical protein
LISNGAAPRPEPCRLISNWKHFLAHKELQTAVAERVISAEVRRRTWRVQILQNRIDAMLALREARAAMYVDRKERAHDFQVNTLAWQRAANGGEEVATDSVLGQFCTKPR